MKENQLEQKNRKKKLEKQLEQKDRHKNMVVPQNIDFEFIESGIIDD
jgi:hypothetical protein